MVLVDHEPVEAHPVGQLVLGEIALVVGGGLRAVEEAVGKGQAERGIVGAFLVRILVMRHLAEVVELHGRAFPPRKSRTSRAKASGYSRGTRWPHRSSTVRVAWGRSRRYCSPHATGTIRSSRPHTISVGLVTRGKNRSRRGLCMYGFQARRAVISRLRSAISSSAGVGARPNSSSHSGTADGSCTLSSRSCWGE